MEAAIKTPLASSAWKRSLQARLLAWFGEHARDLPWRGTRDLYAIWLSEIMLQQTQVVTVVDYFQRFRARFPTVRDLAAAEEHEVLRLWEGLGYYRRARQLHAAAQQVVSAHGGEFPETFDEVLALPGVGRYTAGAILSIGRDARLPILEANTVRVLSRLLAFEGDVHASAGQSTLWQFAEELLPAKDVGRFNQSLMELGATLCTPREPSCLLCPVARLCPTNKRGLQAKIPSPKKKMQYEEVTEAALVIRRADGRVLVRRCLPGERWAGLWDFPRCGVTDGEDVGRSLLLHVQETTGIALADCTTLGKWKHGVTRFRITLFAFTADLPPKSRVRASEDVQWIDLAALRDLPLSVTGRKISERLEK